jgi:hypothetical protein
MSDAGLGIYGSRNNKPVRYPVQTWLRVSLLNNSGRSGDLLI